MLHAKAIICPAGYVIGNIFGNHIAIMCSTNYMVIITALPTKFYIIATGKAGHSLFIASDNHAECRPDCRDAPWCIRPFPNGYNSMDMVGHDDKHWHFHIGIVCIQIFQGLICKFTDNAEMHFTIGDFTEIMLFIASADSHKIITT